MPISIQYDVDGNIVGKVRYPAHKDPPVMPEGIEQQIFENDDVTIKELHIGKKKIKPNWNGKKSAEAFVDRVKTDYEVLREAYSIKAIVAIADNASEWRKFEKEIKKHHLVNGVVKKKAG